MDIPAVTTPLQAGSPRPASVPAILGGCLVRRELLRRTIGPVYLARELAFNRDVAIEVMKPLWAQSPPFVASFTREAYAAAQLRHHHIAAIYRFGQEKGLTYFVTELVDGKTLGAIVRDNGPLEPNEAIAYVLQAARGLKYAHDQNMFHRDLNPETLLVDRQGLVRVLDLGLAKTPEAALTEAAFPVHPKAKTLQAVVLPPATGPTTLHSTSIAMPGYTAPELADTVTWAGPRTDIYSLGGTLYTLVTGRPPFEGRTAVEVLKEQQTQTVVRQHDHARPVPHGLWATVLKMTAGKPADRFADMGDVIRELEGILGIAGSSASPKHQEQAQLLEQNASAWNDSPTARLRSNVTIAILGGCLGLAVLCFLPGWWLAASAFLSLATFTALADLVIAGFRQRSPLFQRLTAFIAGGSLSEWLTVLAGLALLLGLLAILKLFWIWIALALAAIGIALGLRALDLRALAERAAPLELVETVVRSLRREGRDEDFVRQFVCLSSGRKWEELFESLFGYEAKLEARQRWAKSGEIRMSRYAAWRDPIIGWTDAKLAARREANELVILQRIEEQSLISLGENLVTARRKAHRAARAMVATAAEIRETIRFREGTITVNRSIAEAMREAALQPESVLLEHERGVFHGDDRQRKNILATVAHIVVGPKIRFLAGAFLLAGCIAWMHQNAMISREHAAALVDAAKSGNLTAVESHAQAGLAHARETAAGKTEILDLPVIPRAVLALVSSFGAGAGGLILIVSSFLSGARIAYFAIPAAAIPILGPRLGLPAIFGLEESFIPSILGATVMAVGILFGRTSK